ncbi:Uncharacterised protein [Burkholderia pseudomallei]|uniref:hypothetical protein n=1 Tax=Burkholderia pseudomallei TaxID=28450 RepID=UPI00061BB8DE|nr:hypothetical protein [Burkholderia pseudomallei]CPF97383.1 Uncharacterised protein [Burkholderia pseudomallei]
MRKPIKIVIVILEVLLACEVLLWLAFGSPPLQWHTWYLVIVPLGAFIFWPAKRGK